MSVYDCVVYAGETTALVSRLQLLDKVVDHVVVVEAVMSTAGGDGQSQLRRDWSRVKPWAHKLRHVVVLPEARTRAVDRVRGAMRDRALGGLRFIDHATRGMADLNVGDTVVFSEVGRAPDPAWVQSVVAKPSDKLQVFGVAGPPGASRSSGSFGGCALTFCAGAFDNLAWKLARVQRSRVRRPNTGQIIPLDSAEVVNHDRSGLDAEADRRPVIVCPYLHDKDEAAVREAFGLDVERGARLPFFLWQDTEMIGPERAFEYCWNQFPDRDVIIIHPDMRPMPDDDSNAWYEHLIAHVTKLPDAGIVGCDLLFPFHTESDHWAAQCVGGRIRKGAIKHVGGRKHAYDERYRNPRRMHWATFGGVYLRREAIDMVGGFDDRYQWAYVMDVDYCMEVQLRGLRIYQVPVNIIHEQNGTTSEFLANPEYKTKVTVNEAAFDKKWQGLFHEPTATGRASADHRVLPFPGA